MNPKKLFNSFAQSYSKDTGLISTTARINMNNTSTSGFFKLSTSQNLFDKNYSKSHLSDLKKTFYINIDILKQFISSNKNNKDNELISLLNSLIEKAKKKSKIIDKIKEKKSKILIDNQIITDKRSKIEEKNFYYKNKIKENEERLDNKEEYMKVLHKKMREVEIYIHKNTVNLKNFNRKKKYQSFSMFNFVETNNELIKQKKELNKVIENTKINFKVEMEENKQIKQELKNDKENNLIEINQEEIKIKKLSDKYKSKIKLMKSRINMLRNNYNKLNKKIKILKLDEFIPNIDNDKKDDDDIKDLDQIPLETSINMKNSYMDFSVLNTQNFDDNNISKFDAGNVSKIGIYDISIINQN